MRERKNGVIEWTMRHYQITLLVITVLVGLGIWGLVDMPKQEFPEFTIRQGVVVGVYPGATSGEVEEQLAKPLERYLFTFKEVKKKKTYSMSRDGMVYVMVELNDDVNNKDEVWSKIKLGLQNFKSQLPSGVLAVIANDDFGDTSALLITLESEDKTYRELQRYMETLEDRLRRIESVSNLRRYGVQNEQISVYLDPDKLAAYGLDTRMLMTTLFTQGFTTASGSLENGGLDIPIHLSVTYPSEREVGEQILLADADGHMIRLKDVARIVREYPEPDSYITNNGKKAIILSMEMREGHNIVRYGKEVDEVLHAFERDLPESVSIRRIADQPKVVGDSVSSFVRDLFVSIVVVILVMMVLFPFRSALVAATSIPISVFISIGVMESRIIPTLPEGVTYEYGGAKELDFETMNPLMQGLAIAVIIVFFFLLVNFKKIGLALAALSSLLLTLFGAALGLWAFHIDFSLTCVLGVISLIGIVVRNAILIFEHAQDLRLHKHYSPRDAAFDAGRRRMLPIFLTSATTAVGVVPMIISGSSLWMPMGVVICSGTVFSMILAVIILPVFYWKIFGNK